MLRLRVVELFDSMRQELDYFTETKISENFEHESFWNERRAKQIEAVSQIEQTALSEISSKRKIESEEEENVEELSQVLNDFCFTFVYADMIFVATVDKYVDDKQIATFREFIKIESMNSKMRQAFLFDGKRLFSLYREQVLKIESDAVPRLKQMLTVESAVVDMSWWFNREYHIDRVEMKCQMLLKAEDFVCPVRIKTVEITLGFDEHQSLTTTRRKSIESIQNGFSQTESVSITLLFSTKSLDSARAQLIITAAMSINLNSRTRLDIKFENEKCQKCYQDYCDRSGLDGMLRRVKLKMLNLDWFSKVNWTRINEIVFYQYNAQDLFRADFSSLTSLKSCKFINYVGHLNEWSFLDPVRANLEQLTFGSSDLNRHRQGDNNGLKEVSWRMFSGMTKLKQLEMFEYEYEHIQVDAQGRLFADLTQLKTLQIIINSTCLDQDWCCELPELEKLKIWHKNSNQLIHQQLNKLRFNLPKLNSLNCLIRDYELDLAPVFASLSHVETLAVEPYTLQKTNWFRGFKSSFLTLTDSVQHCSRLDGSMLAGLPNLKSLYVKIDWTKDEKTQLVAADTFHELPNLETIKLWVTRAWLDSNRSIFDGLHSLKWIHLDKNRHTRSAAVLSLVYFNNLNKFVIVYD